MEMKQKEEPLRQKEVMLDHESEKLNNEEKR